MVLLGYYERMELHFDIDALYVSSSHKNPTKYFEKTMASTKLII